MSAYSHGESELWDLPAKHQPKRKQPTGSISGSLGSLDPRLDKIPKGGREHEEHPEQQEHGGTALLGRVCRDGIAVEPDGVVPRHKHEHRHGRVPGQFGEQVGHEKYRPRVDLRGALAGLVQIALFDEAG